MNNDLNRRAKKMLTRANALGLVSKAGSALAVDVMEELVAAAEGYRNAHAYRAALKDREPPALEQEYPDEAGNDYKLVLGTGCWIAMGKFSVHPYLTRDGIVVDIHPRGASQKDLATVTASTEAAEEALAPVVVQDVVDALRNIACPGTERQNAEDVAATVHSGKVSPRHGGADMVVTLKTVTLGEPSMEYDLRICAFGPDAYFEWIDQCGDPVGAMFYHVASSVVQAYLASQSPKDRAG